MVISERYNFIFLRIPKNASTSLATFFVRNYCDHNDIYTSIGDSKTPMQNVPPKVVRKHRQDYHFIHMTLNELIDDRIITEQQAYQKTPIGVIRDPIERQLSLFFYEHRKNKAAATVEAFRKEHTSGYNQHDMNNQILQTDYLKIGNKTHGEFWLYDNLDDHLASFIKQHRKPINDQLQSYKSSFKPSNVDLIDRYYDSKTRAAVENYFAPDFELYRRMKNEN